VNLQLYEEEEEKFTKRESNLRKKMSASTKP
jgi:hypothetical protein